MFNRGLFEKPYLDDIRELNFHSLQRGEQAPYGAGLLAHGRGDSWCAGSAFVITSIGWPLNVTALSARIITIGFPSIACNGLLQHLQSQQFHLREH